MPSLFIRLPIRRFVFLIVCALLVYFMIGHSFMPARLKANTARDILSVVPQRSDPLAPNALQRTNEQTAGAEHAQINEEARFEELVQAHQQSDNEKERIRSPDINSASETTSNETKKNVPGLLGDVNKMAQLEAIAHDANITLCPDVENNKDLNGHLPLATVLITNLKEAEVVQHYPFLQRGGSWKPTHCMARYKVAIIVPFRDRQTHLTRLIDALVPVMKRQLLDFRFIVTEQYGGDLFNKGRLLNAAFRVAEKLGVDCVIFHDVDMFPQDDRNSYGCPPSPRHIGAFVSNLGYQLWYKEIVGGVLAVSMDDYRAVNGYSNLYWAWGGEDDDMGKRILSQNITIERPAPETGRFYMLKHVKRKRTAPALIYKLLDTADTRWKTDGVNVTLWKIVKLSIRSLYYHIYVDVGPPPNEWRSHSGKNKR